MLEKNDRMVFDCRIVKPLADNAVYQSYLVQRADSSTAKLLLILPDPLAKRKDQKSFFDHVHWLASQAFPCIGSPLQAGEYEGQLACLYPVPAGQQLSQAVNDGFSVREAIGLVHNIAKCLSVPHSAGLGHGNLSPGTVYIQDSSVFLADFALSLLVDLDYHSGIDPHYTSPEQVRGETPGPAADIYSLGCILYRLVTGQQPFSGEDAFSVALQHLQGSFPKLPAGAELFQPLLDALTEATVSDRSSAEEILRITEQLLADPDIGQLRFPVPADTNRGAVSGMEEDPPGEKTVDHSELADRIEARLKEHSAVFQEPEQIDGPGATEPAATEALDSPIADEKPRKNRFLLLLLLGCLAGSGLYLLFFNLPAAEVPVAVPKPAALVATDLDRGIRLWQSADYSGAEAEFRKLINEFPQDPQAYNNLAAVYASRGDYEQARIYLEEALATDQNYVTIYHNLGSIYAEMARDSYGKALQLNETQQVISLQVFSSEGVFKPGKANTNIASVPAPAVAAEVDADRQSAATDEKPAAAVETVPAVAQPADESAENNGMTQPEQPTVAATDEPVTSETPVPQTLTLPVAAADNSGEDDTSEKISAAVKLEAPEGFLRRWARAWSSQDVDAYLAFYDGDFVPPAGKTRAEWEAQRRSRLTAPKQIEVSLSDFKLTPQKNDRVRIDVVQDYRSDVYADRTRKQFELQQTETGWTILRELSLGRIR